MDKKDILQQNGVSKKLNVNVGLHKSVKQTGNWKQKSRNTLKTK